MLGHLEEQILIIILNLQKHSEKVYRLLIFNKLKDIDVSIVNGSIYNTLHSLETKGLLRSEITENTNQRGGRGKRIYFLENKGLEQLKQSFIEKKAGLHKLETALEKAGKLPL